MSSDSNNVERGSASISDEELRRATIDALYIPAKELAHTIRYRIINKQFTVEPGGQICSFSITGPRARPDVVKMLNQCKLLPPEFVVACGNFNGSYLKVNVTWPGPCALRAPASPERKRRRTELAKAAHCEPGPDSDPE
jgi:hypothetical protein